MADTTDFLSFLVDETLKLQKSGEIELSSLELKLKDYGLSYLKGDFSPQTQMLRFKTKFGPLDIPVNWSFFSIDNAPNDLVLSSENDQDFFFKVISEAWDSKIQKILITHADGHCYLVGLRAGDETHLHDLLNPQEWLKAG